jgi:Kef-type K+ transport system membrane component KefB
MFLASILTIINQSSVNIMLSPFFIFLFILLVFVIFKYVPRLIVIIQKEHSKVSLFSTVLVIGISITALSQFLGFGPMIGAFIAGLLLRWAIKNKHVEEENVNELKVMTFSFIIPFFFINIGLHFDYTYIIQNPWMTLVIIIVATIGKILGSLVVTFFRRISVRQGLLMGWGLNSRGAIELVILEVARQNKLIPPELYSSVVVMAVLTTLIFPFVLRYYLNKYPGIMDE